MRLPALALGAIPIMPISAESLIISLGGIASERTAAYANLEATQDAALGAICVAALATVLGKPMSAP